MDTIIQKIKSIVNFFMISSSALNSCHKYVIIELRTVNCMLFIRAKPVFSFLLKLFLKLDLPLVKEAGGFY